MGIRSTIDLSDEGRRYDFRYDFIYTFEHSGFVYFVTVQRKNTSSNVPYVTKLARVCRGDHGFYSYTEVELGCNSPRLDVSYNIALAADLAVNEADRSKDRLYVAFGRSPTTSTKQADEASGFGVCSYDMSEMRRHFTYAQKVCFRGRGRTFAWINGSSTKCLFNVSTFVSI